MKIKEYKSTGGVYESGYNRRHIKTSRKMSNSETFESNGYLFVPNMVLDPENLKVSVPEQRGRFTYLNNRIDKVQYDPVESQVNGSLSRYNIPIYKELHYLVKAELKSILGMDLYPSYFYDRFYFVGQQLRRHTDRPSCEVSVTLQISTNRNEPWPIWFERPDETESCVLMKNGDAVIYKGCEREHWRDPLPSRYNKTQKFWRKLQKLPDDTYHHQIFLHYVDANGPYVQHAFDATS